MLWKHLPVGLFFPLHFSFSLTSTCVSLTQKIHNTWFLFLKYMHGLEYVQMKLEFKSCCTIPPGI